MKVDGIDPTHLNKIQEYSQKAVTRESEKQNPKQKQQDRVLNKDQQLSFWDRTSLEELEESIKKLNTTAEAFNVELRFRMDEKTKDHHIVISVIERETEQVIREIPPEQVVNMVAQIQDLIGIFVDTRR